jgi:hypothetical protein
MIEAIVISFIVGLAAAHVAFRLSPKLVQRKVRDVMAAGLNKIGLHTMAKHFVAVPHAADEACGSGCDACGAEVAGDELKTNIGAKVVQFHPRLR